MCFKAKHTLSHAGGCRCKAGAEKVRRQVQKGAGGGGRVGLGKKGAGLIGKGPGLTNKGGGICQKGAGRHKRAGLITDY